jgi:16S rRNA (cytosine967-C5)-methyltransferase
MIALDHDKERVKQLYSTLDRLQLKATRVETADAGDKAKRWWNRQHFDAIILDAPCSGSGVIRRHPDIKWLRLPEDLAGFARQQKRLLANLWETLKPGGELLYITCSLFSEENEYVIREFLEKTADAKRMELKHPWLDEKGRMLPNEVRDGFFYAKLQKASKK